MEFRVEELAPCRKKVTVTVAPERVKEALDEQYAEINKQVAMPGFRPGKTPRKLLEAKFGAHIREEVRGKLVEAAFSEAVKEKKVVPLAQPTVSLDGVTVEPGKGLEFAFEVTTRPEFELPTWKGLEVKVPAVAVSDADVDEGVESMRMSEGTLEASTDPIVPDDVAVLDWKALDAGAVLHAAEGAYYRVGHGELDGIALEGADAALAGGKPGTKVTVRGRAAAEDTRRELAGREFDVELEVRDTKRFRPAALDEAFLKRHDFDDVEELRRDVRRRILRARERDRDRVAEMRLVEGLVGQLSFAIPAELVDDAVTRWAERRRYEASERGLPEDEVAKSIEADEARVRGEVEADLRRHFVLDAVAEAEKVEVTEQELVGAVEQIARESGRSAGEVVQHFQEEPNRLSELRSHLRHQKAREALRRAATIVEEAAPAPEPAAAPKKGK
ncbi:MAG: trigger factor [Planctomycetes bacterium]|nr:trigger factor [Planctomycetota bacterium]